MKKSILSIASVLMLTANCLWPTFSSAQYTKIFDFANAVNGGGPYGSLFSDGTYLYGLTGATSGYGLIFKIKPDGSSYTELFPFGGTNATGCHPLGSLISDGNLLYGMAPSGGANYYGTIFKINPTGTGYSDFYSFTGGSNGYFPNGSPIYDGTFLYGMTNSGGANTMGVIFKVMPNGSGYFKLQDFAGVANGSNPNGDLISVGNYLYGMTQQGGTNNDGTIFRIMPDGTNYLKLQDFAGTAKGSNPYGNLFSDGTFLYGMTQQGGANNLGVVFKIMPNGSGYVKLLDFAGAANGSSPYGSLVSDGTYLYGMTYSGGANNLGVIFKIKPDGTRYSKLFDFSYANGQNPHGSLISSGGFLYGMTYSGGTNNLGTIFKYNTCAIDTINSTMVSCYGIKNGTASVVASGGLAAYTYLWSTSPPQTTQSVTDLAAGNYTVTVTDAHNTTATGSITITQPAAALSLGKSGTNASCYNNDGSASITTTSGGTTPYSYLWSSNNSTTQTISGIGAGTYSITVTDKNSCTIKDFIVLNNSVALNSIPICAITVDSISKHNIIVWSKPVNAPIKNFLIYRDTANNNYALIGKVSYDSLSMFTDTVRTLYAANGDPNASTWKYKIAVTDTCGNISAMSPYHKTLFFQNNSGNFSWNDYLIEGQSVPVSALSNYLFQRDNLSNGNYVTIQTLSASSLAYTDAAYSTYQSTATWRVLTKWSISCTPTIINPKNPFVNAINLNTSRSNVYRVNNPTSANESSLNNLVSISPNPTCGVFQISVAGGGSSNQYKIEIYNLFGELVYSTSNVKRQTANEIDLSSQPNGIYFLQLNTELGTANKKLIIQK